MATETKPASRDTRVPHTTRERTSRPTLSVPSGCARLGRASVWSRSCFSGSYGASAGAAMAPTSASSRTMPPNAASFSSAVPDPRVDEAVEEINQQVGRDEAERDEHHNTLHERVVAREHRADHQPADSWQRADGLGDDGAAD